MNVGNVGELWRHPVKSMMGERIPATELGANGVPGDRAWAVRDEVRGGIRGAKKLHALMRFAASYREEPAPGRAAPAPEITLPNGTRLRANAADAAKLVSEALEHEVTLWPLVPAEQLEHYRRGAPTHADLQEELRSIFGRLPDEPLPDLASFPPELFQYESPPGTYFDAYPILLLTDATLRRLKTLAPASTVDVRRFRPNLLVSTPSGVEGFVEQAWVGKRLRVGEAELEITLTCPRCVMVTLPFADVPKDPGLLRAVVRDAEQNVGVYARVSRPGRVREGDAVELVG
jgi:uncharacterized protein YcbX